MSKERPRWDRLVVADGASIYVWQLTQTVASPSTGGFTSGSSTTTELAVLNWNEVLLYPKGDRAMSRLFRPAVKLPPGWKFGTPLQEDKAADSQPAFAPVSLEELIDAPLTPTASAAAPPPV